MGKQEEANAINDIQDKQRRRGIYLLPNILTTAGLFAGFYAIVAAMKGLFDVAAIAVYIAMIWDGLDGRIARLTNTQTPFGSQYDSLSDMVSFGLAPALLLYEWAFFGLGKVGWLAAFLYAAATALRLARFNTQVETADKRYFQGLPCPPAAGVIAGLIWFSHEHHFSGTHLRFVALPIAIIIACLMVSNVRYHSFKKIDMRGKVPFVMILLLVLLFVAVALDPAQNLFLIFFVFALSGPILTLWQRRHVSDRRRHHKEKMADEKHHQD